MEKERIKEKKPGIVAYLSLAFILVFFQYYFQMLQIG